MQALSGAYENYFFCDSVVVLYEPLATTFVVLIEVVEKIDNYKQKRTWRLIFDEAEGKWF